MKGEPRPPDFLDDFLSGLSPNERLRVVVVLRNVLKNRIDQFRHAGEDTATQPLLVEVTEKSLDDVQPS